MDLHLVRMKNIALRDDRTKLRSSLNGACKARDELILRLEVAKIRIQEYYQESKDWQHLVFKERMKFNKTKATLKKLSKMLTETKSSIHTLPKLNPDTKIMLKDTLNAKLRYDAVITEILTQSDQRTAVPSQLIKSIIATTQAQIDVTILKNGKLHT